MPITIFEEGDLLPKAAWIQKYGCTELDRDKSCFVWIAIGSCKSFNCQFSKYNNRNFKFEWLDDHTTVWRSTTDRFISIKQRPRVAVYEPYYPIEKAISQLQPWGQIFNIRIYPRGWHSRGVSRYEFWNIPDEELTTTQREVINNTFRAARKNTPGLYMDPDGYTRIRPAKKRGRQSQADFEADMELAKQYGPDWKDKIKDPLAPGFIQPDGRF